MKIKDDVNQATSRNALEDALSNMGDAASGGRSGAGELKGEADKQEKEEKKEEDMGTADQKGKGKSKKKRPFSKAHFGDSHALHACMRNSAGPARRQEHY